MWAILFLYIVSRMEFACDLNIHCSFMFCFLNAHWQIVFLLVLIPLLHGNHTG